MSKKGNRTLIGLFVLGAVALAILAVIILGSGRLFHETRTTVMYFEGSVKGLSGPGRPWSSGVSKSDR